MLILRCLRAVSCPCAWYVYVIVCVHGCVVMFRAVWLFSFVWLVFCVCVMFGFVDDLVCVIVLSLLLCVCVFGLCIVRVVCASCSAGGWCFVLGSLFMVCVRCVCIVSCVLLLLVCLVLVLFM